MNDNVRKEIARLLADGERERHNKNREDFAEWLTAKKKKPIDPFIPTGEEPTQGTAEERKARGGEFLGDWLGLTQPVTEEAAVDDGNAAQEDYPEVPHAGNAEQTAGEYHEPKKSIAEQLADKLNENRLTDDGDPWHRL